MLFHYSSFAASDAHSVFLMQCNGFIKLTRIMKHNRKACRDEAQQQSVTSKLGTQAAGGAANYSFGVFDVQIFN